jgi:hypothetical protein
MDWPNGSETIAKMAARSPRVLLSFSRGKDSIAMWLAMRGHFEKIVPYYFYLVPGLLDFEKRSLEFYEKFFDTEIIKLPSPAIYIFLNEMIFCAPERCATIEAANLPEPTKDEFADWLREDYDLPEAFNAIGIRIQDSLARRAMLRKIGPINEKRKTFYPVWDMNKDALIDIIKRTGCKLPEDYRIMGSSFDSLTYRYLKPISVYYPQDYKRILHWYPLADLAIYRREVLQNG